ncbi:hypothetical protein GJV11_16750 [Enterobacteriaceae bacterium RIT693]|nr:hypothetical protein [Enterobacteriaceae bacterium RIT693]
MKNFINEWRVASMTKKIGLIASICTILGLILSFYSSFVSSNEVNVNNNSQGAGGLIVGNNSGSVTINNNQQNSASTTLILRNPSGGVSGVVAEPNLSAATDPTKFVCRAITGTRVSLTGRTSEMNGIVMWKEISILDGDCSGKSGWVSISNLAYK